MSNQDILNALSELECALFYRRDGSDDNEGVIPSDLKIMHYLVNEALKKWHAITGLTTTD